MTAYRAILLDEVAPLPGVPVPLLLNNQHDIGRASAFLRAGGVLTCTLEVDGDKLERHRDAMQDGCAWYAGEFKVQHAVGV